MTDILVSKGSGEHAPPPAPSEGNNPEPFHQKLNLASPPHGTSPATKPHRATSMSRSVQGDTTAGSLNTNLAAGSGLAGGLRHAPLACMSCGIREKTEEVEDEQSEDSDTSGVTAGGDSIEPICVEPGTINIEQTATVAADTAPAPAANGSFEFQEALDELLPIAGDKGIFEVSFSNGETMGVAVAAHQTEVSFLLNPSSAKLGERLRTQQMELEGKIERHIRRSVKITVL